MFQCLERWSAPSSLFQLDPLAVVVNRPISHVKACRVAFGTGALHVHNLGNKSNAETMTWNLGLCCTAYRCNDTSNDWIFTPIAPILLVWLSWSSWKAGSDVLHEFLHDFPNKSVHVVLMLLGSPDSAGIFGGSWLDTAAGSQNSRTPIYPTEMEKNVKYNEVKDL